MVGSNPFEGLFNAGPFPPPSRPEQVEKGVAWQVKEFNGKLYLPAEQVVELLISNGVLPKMSAALSRHVRKKE